MSCTLQFVSETSQKPLTSHLDSSSAVPVNVSRAPGLWLGLCSGARQQSQWRLGYRQEY